MKKIPLQSTGRFKSNLSGHAVLVRLKLSLDFCYRNRKFVRHRPNFDSSWFDLYLLNCNRNLEKDQCLPNRLCHFRSTKYGQRWQIGLCCWLNFLKLMSTGQWRRQITAFGVIFWKQMTMMLQTVTMHKQHSKNSLQRLIVTTRWHFCRSSASFGNRKLLLRRITALHFQTRHFLAFYQ